jgi:predicted dinucleotide-binding enzyme
VCFPRAGHTITYGVRDPSAAKHQAIAAAGNARIEAVAEALLNTDAVVLAVPFEAVDDALSAAGDLTGRLLIDATNPLRMGTAGLELSLGFDHSAGEHVASLAPNASVFKTLNQVGFELMENAAEYDAVRKPTVMQLVTDLGFDAVDAGGLRAARLLEPLGMPESCPSASAAATGDA